VVNWNTGKAGNFEPARHLPTDTQTTAKIFSYTLEKTFYLDVVPFECWGTLLVAQLVEALRYKSEGRGFDSG